MNRSKIEWCDHTWNPITGCLHGCTYCYARTMAKRFSGDVRLNKMAKNDYVKSVSPDGETALYILEKAMMNEKGSPIVYPFGFEPTLHRYRFDTLDKLKMGNNIFVGAMADVFGEWVPEEWIIDVLQECINRPQHNYLFLTKNPNRYIELELEKKMPWADNFWFGTSVTKATDKYTWFKEKKFHWFLSVEPMLEGLGEMAENAPKPEWVIIGAETGNRRDKVVPKKEWVEQLVSECRKYGIPVFMKASLAGIWDGELIQEFPEALKRKTVSEKLQGKLINHCCMCSAKQRKNEMITLIAKSVRNENKRIGYICKPCFLGFCEEHQLENDLQVFKNKEE